MTLKRLLLLDVALLALMVLASRLALVLHEVGGHAVPAKVLGASAVEVRLSPLGGGYVSPTFPKPVGNGGKLVFDLGGIAINLLTGAAAWILARRLASRGLGYVALLFLGVGSVAGAIVYLSCGLYYGSGDPVGFAPETEDISRLQWMWVLFLPAAAAVGWFAPRHFLDFLARYLGTETARRRLLAVGGTVGLAGLAYFGLWLAVRNPQIEGSTRAWRIQQEIEKETIARAKAQAAKPQPPPPPAERPAPAPAPIVVHAEEVADRVPPPVGPIVLYSAFLAAGIVSIIRARPSPGSAAVRPAIALGLAALAAVIVGLFRLFG